MFNGYLFIFVTIYFELVTNIFASPGIKHEKCSLMDSECLTTQAKNILNAFTDGNPELGIEKLDKMLLDPINTNQDGLKHEMDNLTVEGLSNSIIDSIWIDTDLNYIHVSFSTTLDLEFDYKADGHVFSLPITGAGKAHIIKKNVIIELILLFDIKKNDNGKDIIQLKDYRYGYNVIDPTVYRYENLYNGDKAKSEKAHDFINRNWRTTSGSFVTSWFGKVIDKIFKAIKTYLQSFPLEDIALLN